MAGTPGRVGMGDATPFDRSRYKAPSGAGKLAMSVFLVSLTMFFSGSLFGYAYVRMDGPFRPPTGAMGVPSGLWLSTAVLLASGWTMHRAVRCVRRERQRAFCNYMTATALLGVLFVGVQGPSLVRLLREHQADDLQASQINLDLLKPDDVESFRVQAVSGNRQAQLCAFIVTLIVLHALHVVGGLFPLGVATLRSWQGAYDHEVHRGVLYCAMYWHFLDGVWLVMFAAFLLLA